MKIIRPVIAISVIALVLSASACKRGEESSNSTSPLSVTASPNLVNHALLTEAPKGTFGFWTYENNSEAAQKLRASPWNAGGNQRFIKAMQSGADQPLKPLFDAMERAGIIDADPTKAPKFERVVIFGSQLDAASEPQLSSVGIALPGIDLAQSVQKLKSELSAPGMLPPGLTLSDATVDGTPAFQLSWQVQAIQPTSVAPSDANAAPTATNLSVYIVGKDKRLVASTSPEAAASLLKGGATGGGVAELTSSPGFMRVTQGMTLNTDTLSFAYLDANRSLAALTKLGPLLFGSEFGIPNTSNSPVESLAASASFDQALEGGLQVSFTPRNESQSSTLKRLATASQNGSLQAISSSVTAAIMIDGRLLQEVFSGAKASGQLPPEALAALAPLEGVRGLAIALKNPPANTAAMYPELVLVVDSATSDKLEAAIKDQLNAVVASGQAPITPMQQSTVEGVPVNFVQSMIGIGAYLANSSPNVIIASSQTGVGDAITASTKSKDRLVDALSAKARTTILETSPLLMAHINFAQAAQMVEGLQGTLAMFTGGKPLMEPEALADLRKFGVVDAGVVLKGDVLRANVLYREAGK